MDTRTLAAVAAALGVASALSGCTTAPGLNFDGSDSKLTVDAIRSRVFCELQHASLSHKELITVLLTLQVDDQGDVTPAMTYTKTLHGFSAATAPTLATSLGFDFGIARRRTFTTTYTLDGSKIPSLPGDAAACDKGYDLKGDLHLAEIVRDGRAATEPPAGGTGGALIADGPDGSKAIPSYGSQVQFIITRQLSSFGPTWMMRYIKWPSGSSGLVNGKRLDTDSVLITIAPIPTPATPKLAAAAVAGYLGSKVRLKDNKTIAQAAHEQVSQLAGQRDTLLNDLQSAAVQKPPRGAPNLLNQKLSDLAKIQSRLTDVQGQAASADADVAAAQSDLTQAQARADQATTRPAANLAAAAQATHDQLTNMLLQNLSNLPRP